MRRRDFLRAAAVAPWVRWWRWQPAAVLVRHGEEWTRIAGIVVLTEELVRSSAPSATAFLAELYRKP